MSDEAGAQTRDGDTGSLAPKAFVSYSWDSPEHTDWVLNLATRLLAHGVDVTLDRWDTRLGSDLAFFMEQAADLDFRVLAVVSTVYVEKANQMIGGVGYEKKVITPTIMDDLTSARVVPILRNNPDGGRPRFLAGAKYIDFRDDSLFEDRFYELLQELHGIPPTPKPALGPNPFAALPADEVPLALRHDPARYVSPALAGRVTFDYTNNSGKFVIGAGDSQFTIALSSAGHGSIHLYNDPADIKTVAVAPGVSQPYEVDDPSAYDGSSRSRTVRVGDAAILRNDHDYWGVVSVEEVLTRDSSTDGQPSITFSYAITMTPSPSGRLYTHEV